MTPNPKTKVVLEAEPAYKIFRDDFVDVVADLKKATGKSHVEIVAAILDVEAETKWYEKSRDIAKRELKRAQILTVYKLLDEVDRRTESWHINHQCWPYVQVNIRHAKEFLATGEYDRAISRLTGVIMGLNLRK